MKQYSTNNSHAGFTLVELSIVLIIIGLVVGGVVGGQSLIRASAIRGTISQFLQYQSALNLFELKYDALPGDMGDAREYWPNDSQYSGFSTGWSSSSPSSDKADGKLAGTYEQVWAWQQLALAGLIQGTFNGIETTSSPIIGLNVPAAKIDGAGFIFSYQDSSSSSSYGKIGTVIRLFTYNEVGSADKGGSVTPAEAESIDKKMDDGFAATGNVRASDGKYYGLWQGCIGGGDVYDLSKTNPWCRVMFFFTEGV